MTGVPGAAIAVIFGCIFVLEALEFNFLCTLKALLMLVIDTVATFVEPRALVVRKSEWRDGFFDECISRGWSS